ncbi:hypothetical protein D3C78_966810 [compost metagenome]
MAALAAELFQHAHAIDDHAAINCLAHIVNGQRSDTGSGQRFHFHAGLPGQLATGNDVDGVIAFGTELDLDAGQQQRVAQRDQVTGLFRCLDTGNTRHSEDITLGVLAIDNHLQGFGEHAHPRFSHRLTRGHSFFGNVDHIGATLGIEMSQHSLPPVQEQRV